MRGKLLQLIGASLMCAAFLAFFVLQYVRGTYFSIPAWEIYAVGLPVIFGLLVAGGGYYSTGKKISARLVQPHATQDPREPVVYLRSFKDDPVAAKGPEFVMAAGGAIGGMLTSFVGMVTSEEEQLANVMQEIGPFIAIGRPGENLPELGATRVYVSDAEWQEKVRELISRARLVVLRAGSTAGFWWEVERVARDVSPEKLLFLLPYDAAQYGVFRQRLQAYLPCQLPPYPEGGAHIGSVRGILFFQPDWTPHLARVKQSGQSVDWVREFKRSLEPVFNQLQVKTKKPTSDLAHGAWVVLYFLIGLAALVLITWIMSLFER